MISKSDNFFASFYVDLCWILAPSWGVPGRLLDALGHSFPHFWGSWLALEPHPWGSWLALGPKMAQRSPQEGSQDRFLSPTWPPDPLQETQLGPTWLQQGPNLAPSWTQLGSNKTQLGPNLLVTPLGQVQWVILVFPPCLTCFNLLVRAPYQDISMVCHTFLLGLVVMDA